MDNKVWVVTKFVPVNKLEGVLNDYEMDGYDIYAVVPGPQGVTVQVVAKKRRRAAKSSKSGRGAVKGRE